VTLDPVERHARNAALLDDRTVVVPGYPGSGAALVGKLLAELGLDYFDPYTEDLRSDGSVAQPGDDLDGYRRRLDPVPGAGGDGGPRFVKTHRYPREFAAVPLRAVVLLVRDPRDAIHSYYQWRLGFSEEGERGSFAEFLARPGPDGTPVQDWTAFNAAWSACPAPISTVLRFEDLKSDPAAAMAKVLTTLGLAVDEARLAEACRRSSFDSMRAHEDAVAGGDSRRIMRKGQVGEWRQWLTGPLAVPFAEPSLWAVAGAHGYSTNP